MKNTETIVYYSGFWYSTHSPIGMSEYDVVGYHKKTFDQLIYDLRSLALIFDIIHVPRSHLLTFHTTNHWDVVKQYLRTKDFSYFVDNSILLSSTLPYIDNYSDTERIIERVKHNRWSHKIDNDFLEAIKVVKSVQIDSGREARNNVDIFQEYIALLQKKNKKVGMLLNKIKKKSSYKFTPFLHEIFIEEVSKHPDIDNPNKQSIWKTTNSIYLQTGCLDLSDDRRISLNNRIEDVNARRDNSGLLRELYSPKFIQSLIEQEIGEKYLIKFLNGDISKVMTFRSIESWRHFKSDIFEMFETINLLEKVNPDKFANYDNEHKIQAYKKHLLELDSSGLSNIIADLMTIAGETYDPLTGKVVGSGKKIIVEKLIKIYSDWKLTKKLHFYKSFWKELKNELDRIKE